MNPFKLFNVLKKNGIPAVPCAAHPHMIATIALPLIVSAQPWSGNGFRTIVARYGDIAPALAAAHAHSPFVMIQQYIMGHEIACGVMAQGTILTAFMPVDTIPRQAENTVPWHLQEKRIELLRERAVQAHRAINAARYSCVRFIVSENDAYITDIAWAPPLLPHGMFVESARAVGLTLPELRKELYAEYE